ncbi:hypothetical protein ACFL4G_09605 [Thermodesulfobacteriota bacterium]
MIDCSGAGTAIRMYNTGSMMDPRSRQLSGCCILVDNICRATKMTALKVPYVICKAIESNELPEELRFTTFSFDKTLSSGMSICMALGEAFASAACEQLRRQEDLIQ